MRNIGLVLVAAALAGCGSKNNACVPGMSAACACSDGSAGAQTCQPNGTFGVCQCSGTSGGTGGSGGSGSSGGSPGGTGGGGDMAMGGGGSTPGAKRVFVTSTAYNAMVAPTVCQNVAESASLGGTWIAWLSWTNHPAIDHISGTGPWALVTGESAFANHGQLATAPSVVIDTTETGSKLATTEKVWTGTATGGQPSGVDCADFSLDSGSYSASVGLLDAASHWTDGSVQYCSYTAHVYCFEQ